MEAISFIDPAELTEFARLARADFDAQSQSLARFLPYAPIDDIRFAYTRGADALVDEATFRAYDAESPIGRRPGTARITGEIPAISRKIPLSEYAQLRLRSADAQEAGVIAGVYRDAERLARGIAARIERARGDLLQTGKVTLAENGVYSTYDSGRDASLTVTSAPSNGYWSNHSGSTPIADMIGWADTVEATNEASIRPNRILRMNGFARAPIRRPIRTRNSRPSPARDWRRRPAPRRRTPSRSDWPATRTRLRQCARSSNGRYRRPSAGNCSRHRPGWPRESTRNSE